ncbi:MAG: tetratricopeptide repeat protein [Aeromicrobium sp.]|nr:tetratricopeptide repeat protein [Burkholderiales bacterium]
MNALHDQQLVSHHSWIAATCNRWRLPLSVALVILIVGCAVAPTATGPTPDELAKIERLDRANSNLNDGLKQYEAGNYDAAMKAFLVALDSSLLTPVQQLNARKHMAFMQCLTSRESRCKEEFEKAFALDAKFDLSPAEAGHPIWGPVFRTVKSEVDGRRQGRTSTASAPKVLTAGEKLMAEGITAYDAADYPKAIKFFQDALKETLVPDDQVRSRKFTAFSFCLTNRMTLCRQEFDKILQGKPDFDLLPAEAGHPSWGPSFRQAKARLKPPVVAPTKN